MKKHAKHPVHHKKKSFSISKNFVYVLIAVLVLGVAIYYFTQSDVVAKVNDQKIYAKQVETLANLLPDSSTLTKQQILQRLVDAKILVDYAETKGYFISDEDFEKLLNQQLSQSGKTQEQLEEELALEGATLDDVREAIVLRQFIETEVIPFIKVTDADVVAFRLQNPESTLATDAIRSALASQKHQSLVAAIISSHKASVSVWMSSRYE